MNSIVLLDTGIVGGLLSEIDGKKEKWNELVELMLQKIQDGKFAIPTPVWFEIAQWHPKWCIEIGNEISSGCKGIYQYAGYTIPNNILMDAARYKCHIRKDPGNPDSSGVTKTKDKISMVDALIAAYCLRYGYFLITLNQSDFPEKFFEIIYIKNCPSTTEYQRDLAFLLKPRQEDWQSLKI